MKEKLPFQGLMSHLVFQKINSLLAQITPSGKYLFLFYPEALHEIHEETQTNSTCIFTIPLDCTTLSSIEPFSLEWS